MERAQNKFDFKKFQQRWLELVGGDGELHVERQRSGFSFDSGGQLKTAFRNEILRLTFEAMSTASPEERVTIVDFVNANLGTSPQHAAFFWSSIALHSFNGTTPPGIPEELHDDVRRFVKIALQPGL